MFKKGLTISLVGTLMLLPTTTFALTKDETVYCKLNSNGECNKTIVTDHYINNVRSNELNFTSNLTNISNLNGDEKINSKDNSITVKANGKDIYVEGNSTKQLPIKLNISYSINGKIYEPSKMKGKKGHVVITVKYTNLDKHDDIYTPFVVTLGTELNTKNNSNISVTNGKVLSTGSNDIVAAIAAPGLYESLNIDSLKGLDTIIISYDTTKFENTSLYSVITPKLLSDSDLNVFSKLSPIYSSIGTLENSMNQIVNGSNEFSTKFSEYSSKMDEVEAYSKVLSENYTTINEGINKINIGLKQLNNATKDFETLATATNSLAEGTQKLANSTDLLNESLANTILAFNTHVTKLQEIAQTTTDEQTKQQINQELLYLKENINVDALSQLSMSVKAINVAAQQINGGVIALNNNTNTLVKSINSLYNGSEQLKIGSFKYNEGINTYKDNIVKLNTATKQLEAGNITLNNGLNKFNNDGIKKMSDIINNKIKSVQYKAERLIELSNEYNSYTDSNVDGNVKFILVTNKK